MGQMGLPVSRFNTNRKACLVGCASALIVRPFFCRSNRIGAAGNHIPEAVVHRLVMPPALTGADIDRD